MANYVRELKLSAAAELLLDSDQRVIDIAIALGFNSEIAFSRAFKQFFGHSPRTYRNNAQRIGLKKPIEVSEVSINGANELAFVEVRIDTKEAFILKGVKGEIKGLFSLLPDFSYVVPKLWQQLEAIVHPSSVPQGQLLGVVDVTKAAFDGSNLFYWAGLELHQSTLMPQLPSVVSDELDILNVPQQTYAAVKHKGPIETLPKTLEWFILHWLPNSDYRGIDGYELEVYPQHYQADSPDAEMEYWVPISKV
ncbi:transcriptional activator [Vibrio orientalis CIP 102891 = ATCC 33934]|uniref:Transcriptional activator n=1 Tax=Vibrio orientalis CIP 102891 = ATCC 33934 TaxID=675816 RepID=A0ABP2H3E0_VIBOR|nr:transcriptional activator [Vibrio orientalis CIP 102891 = ATCC 33934]